MSIDRATLLDSPYDGDEVMHSLIIDKKMARLFYPFSPFFNLLLLTKPYEISGNASITDPIIASISNWMENEKRDYRRGIR